MDTEGQEEFDYQYSEADEGELEHSQDFSHCESDEPDMTAEGIGDVCTDEEIQLLSNPNLRQLFNKYVDERIKTAMQKGESSGKLSQMSPQNKSGNNAAKCGVKSPSDTTVYAPALAKRHTGTPQGYS